MKTLSARRAVWLVAKRELNTRLRARSFVISTGVLLVLLIGFVLLQSQLSSSSSHRTVGLTGQASGIAQQLKTRAAQAGQDLTVVTVPDDENAGRAQVTDGKLDALVSGSASKLTVSYKSTLDDQLRQVLDQVAQQQVLQGEFSSVASAVPNFDPAKALAEVNGTHVVLDPIAPEPPGHQTGVILGIVVAFLLYLSIITYGMMVAQGVVEEKTSRVVEILLSSVRPWQLLLGKVVGLGTVGLVQLVILTGAGGIAASATGLFSFSGFALGAVLWGLVWYLLGFLLYATVYGALASMVSRQEDTQAVIGPVNIVLIAGFVGGINLLTQSPDGSAAKIVSLIPLMSPLLMPARIASGSASGWEIALSLALTVILITILTAVGGRIYRNSVLRIGSRVKLLDALRG